MAYALIDWDVVSGGFTARCSNGTRLYHAEADRLLTAVLIHDKNVQVNEQMPGDRLVQVMAAAIFARVPLRNMAGKEITETPVADATVSYITREQIGKVLPDGWFIECQLNRYSACWGEDMTFPARKSVQLAIADIHFFLAQSVKSSADDLVASIEATASLGDMTQASMWLSSDRPGAAVDASTELDSIA